MNNKKTIAIITLHSPMNCGSVLQGYALNYYLNNELNQNSYIIDYVPSYMENEGKAIRNLIRKTVFFVSYAQRKKNFADFVKSNDRLSVRKYKTYDELIKYPPEADIYMTGSDQLWNPCFACGNDDAFFLRFVSNVRKIAYSTSMGTAEYSQEQLKRIAEKISDFEYVSVRESCSVKQLESVGIKDPKCVCDPTLLLHREQYDKLAINFQKIGKYVAVYLVEHSELLDYILDSFRKQGYKIVGVGGYLRKYKCDVHFKDAGPSEFLGLIRDASFVVATSFHACVFSHIFHKEFVIIPPKINSERIRELLKISGLSDRMVTKKEDFDSIDSNIDYEEVQSRLDNYVSYSKEELSNAIKGLS